MKDERFDPATLIASLESEGYRRIDIARAAKLPKSTVTKLATGAVRRPSYQSVQALKSLLQVSPKKLQGW